MYVTPSETCKTRDWWPNVKYMENSKFRVAKVEEHYISFYCRGVSSGIRRWHKSNLRVINPIYFENK